MAGVEADLTLKTSLTARGARARGCLLREESRIRYGGRLCGCAWTKLALKHILATHNLHWRGNFGQRCGGVVLHARARDHARFRACAHVWFVLPHSLVWKSRRQGALATGRARLSWGVCHPKWLIYISSSEIKRVAVRGRTSTASLNRLPPLHPTLPADPPHPLYPCPSQTWRKSVRISPRKPSSLLAP